MKPVSPIELEEVTGAERLETFCAPGVCQHEPKHIPLPVLLLNDGSGSIVTRWQFNDRERAKIAAGADLYLYLDTSNQVPPMLPTLFGPHTIPEVDEEEPSPANEPPSIEVTE